MWVTWPQTNTHANTIIPKHVYTGTHELSAGSNMHGHGSACLLAEQELEELLCVCLYTSK